MNTPIQNKIDFAIVIGVNHANPNGDPLNANRPRQTIDRLGEISDVCLKRKMRNRLLAMGEEIFVGDLEKEISKVDGVINLINLDIIPKNGEEGYSISSLSQPTTMGGDDDSEVIVDLDATDGVLYNDGDTMIEIRHPEKDILIRIKER